MGQVRLGWYNTSVFQFVVLSSKSSLTYHSYHVHNINYVWHTGYSNKMLTLSAAKSLQFSQNKWCDIFIGIWSRI